MHTVLLALALALPPPAAGWSTTFEVGGVAARLGIEGKRVIVAAPGGDAQSIEAARALRAAVKDDVKVLLDEGALGANFDDDEGFLKRAKKLPVERFVSVRVFPSEGGALVVVTAYDKAGEATAISGNEGEPLPGGLGVRGEEAAQRVDSVGAVVGEKVEARASRVEDYEKQFLWVGTGIGANQYGAWTYDIVYQGKYKKKISNREMYALFDDEKIYKQLEDAQSGWMTATYALTALTAVTAAGTVGAIVYGTSQPGSDGFLYTLLGGLVGGTCLASYGWTPCMTCAFANDQNLAVLKPEQLREEIDLYNKELAKELELEGVDLPRGYRAPLEQAF